MSSKVLVEQERNIRIVTINRPDVLNALDLETKGLLAETFQQLNHDDDTRVCVLKGAGDRAFCAGQDIHEAVGMSGEDATEWVKGFDVLYRSMRTSEKPIVCSIQGFAVGAGFQVAVLADFRIASESAQFAMTEINIGIPCITGSALLWPILGRARTLDLIQTGRFLGAQEAFDWGIVTEVVSEDPSDQALELARTLAQKPPTALRLNKKWINELTEDVYQRGIAFAKAAHSEAYGSGEAAEHMQRFLSKERS